MIAPELIPVNNLQLLTKVFGHLSLCMLYKILWNSISIMKHDCQNGINKIWKPIWKCKQKLADIYCISTFSKKLVYSMNNHLNHTIDVKDNSNEYLVSEKL